MVKQNYLSVDRVCLVKMVRLDLPDHLALL